VPSPDRLLLFALAAGALIAIPGPAVLFVVTRALGHGRERDHRSPVPDPRRLADRPDRKVGFAG